MRTYSAAIVGLGNIGWKFTTSPNGSSLSHRSAYEACPRTVIRYGVSPVREEREAFEAAYGVPAHASLEALLETERPDIVSICSPTGTHFEQTLRCLEHGVPMVWLEKPPATTAGEVATLIEAGRRFPDTKVLVNFQRRYVQCYRKLRDALADGTFGPLRRLEFRYSRSLLTNGSHMLDMLFFMPGTSGDYTLLGADGTDAENPSFCLRFANGPYVTFSGLDLAYHDIDIVATCDRGRLSVLHGGMTTCVEEMCEHELFPGFYRLVPADNSLLGESGFDFSFDKALADLLDAREHDRLPLSNLQSAYRGQLLMEQVFARVRS